MQESAPTESIQPGQGTLMNKVALLFCVFVAGIGNSFVFAILPPVGREMGFPEIQIGLIVTVSATVFMFTARFWGNLSERVGRKPILLMGLFGYFITSVLFASVVHMRLQGILIMTVAYVSLILLRAIFSACVSGIFPASQAYMADITTLEKRTASLSLIGICMGLGMTAGPAVAAAFSDFGLILPFYAVAALSLPAALLVIRWVVDVPREHHEHHRTATRLPLLELLPFFVISTGIMITLSTLQTASGFYFQDLLELSAEETMRSVGIALMTASLSGVVAQLIFVQRFNMHPKRLLRAGVPLAFLGVLILQSTESYGWMVAAMGCFGLGFGQIMPGTIASLSLKVGIHQQGRVAGINTSAQGLGFIVGPLIGSGLYTPEHPLLPYRIVLGVLALLFAVVLFAARFPD